MNKNNLLEENLYLVGKIAANFKNTSESQETLEEVGYIGLLNAVNIYAEQGSQVDFKYSAQIMITKEIHQYLFNDTYQVEQPPWLTKINQRINQYVIKYRRKYQKFPLLSEIADNFNLTAPALQEVLKGRESLRASCPYHRLEDEIKNLIPDLVKIKSESYQNFKLPVQDIITLQKAFLKLQKLQRGIIYFLFVMDLRKTKTAHLLGLSDDMVNKIRNGMFPKS